MSLKGMSKDEKKEMSFIELAFEILKERKQPVAFSDLVEEISSILEIDKKAARGRLVQFYTDLNVEGSFITLGENRWGLREWYPIDQQEEETAPTIKPRKKKAKKVEEEDIEEIEEEDFDYDDLDDFEEEDLVEDDEDDDDDDDEDFDDIDEEEEIEEDLIEDDDFDLGDDEEEEEELEDEIEEEDKEDL
ncbi:DNA-directed RNA polymerase subunit delta [Falsibacillus pallidus]|uniref:Probable DNA-directed RNA polymerase subunit delta n=1 Tax=Falsibacillus pallidus TaxID=493781 RepID=A0A370GDX2_9BACI|nr:DNA-directed RNA polymerase subunit delta [Falsibacillus pallidus]RDI41998.1 DNA-directed RNA polymerase subunit delta [Falsibacillus pallidus]